MGRGSLLCACLQVISGWFHSDEQLVPFEMLAGSGRPASRKDLIQQLEVSDLIRLHQNPVGKGTTTGAANLIRQELDRAVEDSVIVRLKNAISAVIVQPNHAPVFDGPPEQRIRLQQHPQPFWRGFRLSGDRQRGLSERPLFLLETGQARIRRTEVRPICKRRAISALLTPARCSFRALSAWSPAVTGRPSV